MSGWGAVLRWCGMKGDGGEGTLLNSFTRISVVQLVSAHQCLMPPRHSVWRPCTHPHHAHMVSDSTQPSPLSLT